MGQIIIGVVIFIIIIIIQAKKARATAQNSVPTPHNENFPFPEFDADEDDDEEEWLGRRVADTKPVEVKQVKLMAEYAAVGTIKSEKIAPKQEFDEFEFDAEKAVIYAEILAPKYKDYE